MNNWGREDRNASYRFFVILSVKFVRSFLGNVLSSEAIKLSYIERNVLLFASAFSSFSRNRSYLGKSRGLSSLDNHVLESE